MVFWNELKENKIIWVAVLSWAIAQVIKVLIDILQYKTFDPGRLVGTGGMPSSHTSFVTALTTAIGIQMGFNTEIFALAMAFALVVMYDATGIRRAAGNHAKAINDLIEILSLEHIPLEEKLKELLGHTPFEVFGGAVLGIGIAVVALL